MKHLKIACLRLGGIGDSLESANFAVAVKRKYPDSDITVFVRDRVSADMLVGHEAVKETRVLYRTNRWILELLKICCSKEFDIIYDNRYVTRTFYKDEKRFAEDKKKTDEAFNKYASYYHVFPMRNNELAKFKWKESNRALSLHTACLEGNDNDAKISLKYSEVIKKKKYVTIHNGDDVARGSKCWTTSHWKVLTKMLQGEGYAVIQLGRKGDEVVKGADNLVGKLPIKSSATIIKDAEFHIDTESGLVHIANAVKTKSIVLFGPTPISFFGYKDNINIQTPSECNNCWWTHGFWWRKCPKTQDTPSQCMTSITPSLVMDAVNQREI